MIRFHFPLLILGSWVVPCLAQQTTLVPHMPSLITDERGHEWYIEQNGVLQRNSNGPTMIGNCMMLQMNGQQFYTPQAMMSPDGKELTMASQQPIGGISLTRRITVMEREGVLRYVEELVNTTGRDLTVTLELRHGLNTTAREVTSNLGRPLKDVLEPGESGILALPPAEGENRGPGLLFSVRAPKSAAPLRLRIQNKYQISVLFTLTIPAGQTQSLVHAVTQIDLPAAAKAEDIAKACAPMVLSRFMKGLSKSVLKTAANLGAVSGGFGLAGWQPQEFWGITPGSSDQLALGKETLLKGKGALGDIAIRREGGRISVARDQVAAIAGPGFTKDEQSWIWLRDGQRWLGKVEGAGMGFTLNSGAELPVQKLDRLVFAKPLEASSALEHTMIELWSGERIAVSPEGHVQAAALWGTLSVPWTEIIAWQKAEEDTLGGLLCLRDGTRVRALPPPGNVKMKTKDLGEQDLDLVQLRQLISPLALTLSEDDTEPSVSFLDLAGEQRVVARVTAAQLTFLTEGGPLSLAPSSIRELRDVSEDENSSLRVFEAELWGGGRVKGSLENTRLRVEGRGLGWDIPARQMLRMVNPVPVTDHALMRRIGLLIQDLGHEQWKTREAASTALRELGPLARSSIQEALKSATDAEVARRLEDLMQDSE
jgi:hypothetical protein